MVQTSLISRQTLSLEVPTDLSLQVSHKQFELLAATNRNIRLERTAAGRLIVNPPTGWETGKRNFSLTVQFGVWRNGLSEPGEAFDSSTGFTLPNGAISSPDLSWISQARWEALPLDRKGTFPNICPDFVVELRSDSDTFKSLQDKMKEYMENGAKLGWLIDPKKKRVEIYREKESAEILTAPTDISGEAVLPGFVLDLRQIWT